MPKALTPRPQVIGAEEVEAVLNEPDLTDAQRVHYFRLRLRGLSHYEAVEVAGGPPP